MPHLVAENHEQHNDIRIIEVAEIISRVATKRFKDGLHGFRTLSYEAFQFTFPVEIAKWQNGCFRNQVAPLSEEAYKGKMEETLYIRDSATNQQGFSTTYFDGLTGWSTVSCFTAKRAANQMGIRFLRLSFAD